MVPIDSNLVSSEQARTVVFAPSLRGFAFADVDQLLDGIAETLARHEVGGVLGSRHLTVQQIEQIELGVVTAGYDIDEVNDFVQWAVWTLGRYESGHQPDRPWLRTPTSGTADKSEGVAQSVETEMQATKDGPETQSGRRRERERVVGEPERQMTSEELLEQARKWLNR